MTLVMYDSIDPSQFHGLSMDAAAGYIDGHWPTYPDLPAHVPPGTTLLSISVFGAPADCIDVEPGNVTNDQGAAWVADRLAADQWKPVVYTGAANARDMLGALSRRGVTRGDIRLWTAHYTDVPHICGKDDGYPAADGTQWTTTAHGRNLDQSLLLDSFFGPVPAPVPPAPYQEDLGMLLDFNVPENKLSLPTPKGVTHIRLVCHQGAHVNIQWVGSSVKVPTADLTGDRRVDVAIPADQTGHLILYSGDAGGPVGFTWF